MGTEVRDLPGEWPVGRPVRDSRVRLLSSGPARAAQAQAQSALHRALRAIEAVPQFDHDGFGAAALARFAVVVAEAAVKTKALLDLFAADAAGVPPAGPASHVVPPGARVSR